MADLTSAYPLGIPRDEDKEAVAWRLRVIRRWLPSMAPELDAPSCLTGRFSSALITVFDLVSLDTGIKLASADQLDDTSLLALFNLKEGYRLALPGDRLSISNRRTATVDYGEALYEAVSGVVRAKLAVMELNAMISGEPADVFALVRASSAYLISEVHAIRCYVDEQRLASRAEGNSGKTFSLMTNALKGIDKRDFDRTEAKKSYLDRVEDQRWLRSAIKVVRGRKRHGKDVQKHLESIKARFSRLADPDRLADIVDGDVRTADYAAKKFFEIKKVRREDDIRKAWEHINSQLESHRRSLRIYVEAEGTDQFFEAGLRLTERGLLNPPPFIKPEHIPSIEAVTS